MRRFVLFLVFPVFSSPLLTAAAADCTLDTDGDGICDVLDACPSNANLSQGQPIKLNTPLVPGGNVSQFAVSADGQWAVYMADDVVDQRFELLAVPLAGGAVRRLNPTPVPGGDVLNFKLTPDSAHAAYRADLASDEAWNLYSADLATGTAIALDTSGQGVFP